MITTCLPVYARSDYKPLDTTYLTGSLAILWSKEGRTPHTGRDSVTAYQGSSELYCFNSYFGFALRIATMQQLLLLERMLREF